MTRYHCGRRFLYKKRNEKVVSKCEEKRMPDGWSTGGTVVRALAPQQCGPGSNPGVEAFNMWVEFFIGSLPCSERFFSEYSGFPRSSKTNTSEFQFDLERTDTFKRVHKNID